MKAKPLILLSMLLLVLTRQGLAGTTGKIAGTVRDAETGEPVIGANVVIDGTARGAAADVKGFYVILNVPPGTYTLKVSAIGYTEVRVTGVRVSVDLTTIQDFKLTAQAVEIKGVVVTAERPVIEMDRTNTAAYVTAEEISVLPVTEVRELIQLQAGVTVDAGGSLHFRGGRANEVAYLVDGVPVTNQFSGGNSIVSIENQFIQELQVISGTFNAEYGQVQSGVINVVTREPGSQIRGKITGYLSDNLSDRSEVFLGIKDFDPLSEKNLQFDLSGPLVGKLSFLASGRLIRDEGWLYGERRFRPEDAWPIYVYQSWYNLNITQRQFGQYFNYADSLHPGFPLFTGDRALVPMNPSEKFALNGKLVYPITPNLKVAYQIFWDRVKSKSYDDYYRYTPDAIPTSRKNGFVHIANVTNTLSPTAFYVANLSYFGSNTQTRLYGNPLDPRYQAVVPSLVFSLGGTQNDHQEVDLATALGKIDFSWQVDKHNLVKVGGEAKRHRVRFKELSARLDPASLHLPTTRGTPFLDYFALAERPKLFIPDESTQFTNSYEHRPVEASLYAQDKLEMGEIILNAGLRFDYFKPDGVVPVNPRATILTGTSRLDTDFKNASAKSQLSPRLGLAFPISDQGVIHAAYGHFFQIPDFTYIYRNSEFEISTGERETIMGNADLKPQQTISYEIGLQQQLSEDYGIDVTVYYKDFRNLLGQEIIATKDQRVYFRYINRDYGFSKGFTVSVQKRAVGLFSGNLDYTYSVSRGNASDPNAVFYNNQSTRPVETEKQVIPLDWDETHVLNAYLTLSKPNNWAVSLIGRFGSGQPYTPERTNELTIETQIANSERKPIKYNADLHALKTWRLWNLNYTLFLRVFNLFDVKSQLRVYETTGKADRRFRRPTQAVVDAANPLFTLQEIDNRPSWYSEPRRVQLGMSIEF